MGAFEIWYSNILSICFVGLLWTCHDPLSPEANGQQKAMTALVIVFRMFSLVTFSDNISHISKPALFNRWPNCLFVCSSFGKGPPLVKDLHIFNLQLQAICISSNMFQWIGLVASTKTCQQEHCHACPRAPPHGFVRMVLLSPNKPHVFGFPLPTLWKPCAEAKHRGTFHPSCFQVQVSSVSFHPFHWFVTFLGFEVEELDQSDQFLDHQLWLVSCGKWLSCDFESAIRLTERFLKRPIPPARSNTPKVLRLYDAEHPSCNASPPSHPLSHRPPH